MIEKLPNRLKEGIEMKETLEDLKNKLDAKDGPTNYSGAEYNPPVSKGGGGNPQAVQTENDVTRKTVFRREDNKKFYNKTVKKGTLQNFAQIDDSTGKVIFAKDGSGVDTVPIYNKKGN